MYKNDKELHTQPASVQFQHSKATRLGPRRSTHPHPVEQTWRNTDRSKSTCAGPEIIFPTKSWATNTQQDLPNQWV